MNLIFIYYMKKKFYLYVLDNKNAANVKIG